MAVPRRGWPQSIKCEFHRVDEDTAVLTSDHFPVELVLRPAPGATYVCT